MGEAHHGVGSCRVPDPRIQRFLHRDRQERDRHDLRRMGEQAGRGRRLRLRRCFARSPCAPEADGHRQDERRRRIRPDAAR